MFMKQQARKTRAPSAVVGVISARRGTYRLIVIIQTNNVRQKTSCSIFQVGVFQKTKNLQKILKWKENNMKCQNFPLMYQLLELSENQSSDSTTLENNRIMLFLLVLNNQVKLEGGQIRFMKILQISEYIILHLF